MDNEDLMARDKFYDDDDDDFPGPKRPSLANQIPKPASLRDPESIAIMTGRTTLKDPESMLMDDEDLMSDKFYDDDDFPGPKNPMRTIPKSPLNDPQNVLFIQRKSVHSEITQQNSNWPQRV